MVFVVIITGIVLLVAAIRNSQDTLFTLVKGDFTGPNNFIYWLVAIIVIGAIGYIPKAKTFSVAFLTLVILVLLLARGNPTKNPGGGFFQQFMQALASTTKPTPATTGTNAGGSTNQGTPFGLPNLSTILPHF